MSNELELLTDASDVDADEAPPGKWSDSVKPARKSGARTRTRFCDSYSVKKCDHGDNDVGQPESQAKSKRMASRVSLSIREIEIYT